jgi:hypothetical protein
MQPAPKWATRQAAENDFQRRSCLESILNVPQRVRFRCFLRLRPCWKVILSSLPEQLFRLPIEPRTSNVEPEPPTAAAGSLHPSPGALEFRLIAGE